MSQQVSTDLTGPFAKYIVKQRGGTTVDSEYFTLLTEKNNINIMLYDFIFHTQCWNVYNHCVIS